MPADWNLTLAEFPGGIGPVANERLSAVASCTVLSLLIQVTVVPTGTFNGLGTNAVVVSLLAPLTIETVDVAGAGAGFAAGLGAGLGAAGFDESPPHPARQMVAKMMAHTRDDMFDRSSLSYGCLSVS
jgi:hypothetical protein